MRRNLIIFVAAVLVIFLLWFFFIFRGQSETLAQARTDVEDARREARRLQAELARLQALQQRAPQLREEAGILDAAMPGDTQQAQFIASLQESANASGIDWIAVSFTPAAPGGVQGVSEVAITMNVSGGYFQVQDFLVRLETLPRAVRIGSVALVAGSTTGGGSPSLNAVLAMRIFVSATPAAPAPAGAAA